MDGNHVRERSGQPYRAGGPGFDLVASKLRHPLTRPGTVRRSSLIDRLAREDLQPIVSVAAAAGYGKTTLLAQWAERDGRAFAWVSADERDNDPKVLLTYVAQALDAVEPVGQRVFDALASPASSVPGSVVPRLGSAFAAMTTPVVLVLDDVHLVRNSECRAALSVLADHVPPRSRLVLSGRDEPPLRIARLRAEGRILEIGPADLALTRREAASLLREAEVAVGEDEVEHLYRRTEGWAVGLYLAALYLREGGSLPRAALSFGGDDRLLSEYVESEFLERISRRRREFLTRAAVLERMSGPFCEAVLDLPGSAATLADLAGSNMLLVPLDRRGEWYRYHHLFRDMLRAELARHEPGVIPVLQRRAAAWCLDHGLPEEALGYSIAAGDIDGAARLVERLGVPTHRQGRFTTLQRWFRWLDAHGGLDGHPMSAVLAALFSAMMGQPTEAERWADAVDRWQYGDATRPEPTRSDPARPDAPDAEAYAAILRALMCRNGVKQVLADADEALRRCAKENIVTPAPALYQGLGHILDGDLDSADSSFEDAVSAGEQAGAYETLAVALCQRSLVAMACPDWSRAQALAGQARAVLHRAGIEESYATPLICAVQARCALHHRDVAAAHAELVSAQRLRHMLTYAMPQLAVQTRIHLAVSHLALGDLPGARILMQEIDALLRRRPGLGTLVGEAQALDARLALERDGGIPGASALTAAELRLLPMLSTHLTLPEIAGELLLSPNTVKSQAYSIYRKLGASSRNQAVAKSRELGLLEGAGPGSRAP
jgi:LuxR family transcriptional regulator, maltose regulon positive regulatory protein